LAAFPPTCRIIEIAPVSVKRGRKPVLS
jgi:hypothetical protein